MIIAGMATLSFLLSGCNNQQTSSTEKNLAILSTPSGSMNFGFRVSAINDGLTPTDSIDRRFRGNRRQRPATDQWFQYEWQSPVTTNEIALFFWDYYGELSLAQSYRIEYWNGSGYVTVQNPVGLGLINNQFNVTNFEKISTTKMRIVSDSALNFSFTVQEWKVLQAEGSPNVPPVVTAGIDRDVMVGGDTYLSGLVKSMTQSLKPIWKKQDGPGKVTFNNAKALTTSATFSTPGDYILKLTVKEGKVKSTSTLNVKVHNPPPDKRLDVVYTKNYKIDNPLWNDRAKAIITSWIPWCINQIERTDLTQGQGGLDNFIEAAKALRGEPHGNHIGYVFSNAWVHQTIESICIALMVDPQGDEKIIAEQKKMNVTLEKWIPIILAAQEPDGYLQTAYTLRNTDRWKDRWDDRNRGTHEGYVAGYFIESAINHYTLTEGTDTRLYEAAKKLADCWVDNIGPGKKAWYDGHQEMEQALVRFGRFVNDMEGNKRGDSYITLAKFLLDNRGGGNEYDQSHLPVQQQYEAVGHAVRAVYNYSAMADVAAETGDIDYQSAVMSLWDNIVNKKYYVTGGVGSGESSEGFGPNYSLRNNAYNESCSSCGLIFFQYKMNLAWHDAKYVDLYEETMYNALLGSLDLDGKNFYYTNPLNSSRPRGSWHVCPCCVGNIPRTLLMIPTWTYVTGEDGIYVNLYIGSTIKVENVAGIDVELVQKTEYPWKGDVSITVNPSESKEFTMYIRVPDRNTSILYTAKPEVSGLKSLSVNGEAVEVIVEKGYAAITCNWKKGDHIDLEIPMEIQRIIASDLIEADRDKVALRYGPMIYNVEKIDQSNINQTISDEPLSLEWRSDLLQGIMVINGKWADGSPLHAIPNWTRNNRLDQADPNERNGSTVWIGK